MVSPTNENLCPTSQSPITFSTPSLFTFPVPSRPQGPASLLSLWLGARILPGNYHKWVLPQLQQNSHRDSNRLWQCYGLDLRPPCSRLQWWPFSLLLGPHDVKLQPPHFLTDLNLKKVWAKDFLSHVWLRFCQWWQNRHTRHVIPLSLLSMDDLSLHSKVKDYDPSYCHTPTSHTYSCLIDVTTVSSFSNYPIGLAHLLTSLTM